MINQKHTESTHFIIEHAIFLCRCIGKTLFMVFVGSIIFPTSTIGRFKSRFPHTYRKRLLDSIINQSGSIPSYSLYLRDFDIDESDRQKPGEPTEFFIEPDDKCLEKTIAIALDSKMPVITLGEKDDVTINHISHIGYHENWKALVSKLIENASLILISPSYSRGVTWEINEIINQKKLEQTIFLKYNNYTRVEINKNNFKREINYSNYWEMTTKNLAKECNIDIGETSNCKGDLIFTINESMTTDLTLDFDPRSPLDFSKKIVSLGLKTNGCRILNYSINDYPLSLDRALFITTLIIISSAFIILVSIG
ncbi:hypothetical protein [Enterovibrio calviensis]|uniref:hypothetical protein n=1 Tax=Enterovibrio calviensis TaxID=91359 RepID=UPI000488F524|nr:hypothetical protein [Enterovibrio calviensis]